MPESKMAQLVEKAENSFGAQVVEGFVNPTLSVAPENLVELLKYLKDNDLVSFNYLLDLTAVDQKDHFVLVYHLRSVDSKVSLGIKVSVDRDTPKVPSVTSLWKGANWHEREAFDLFGIEFAGHPNLTRILLPEDWVGHPLRKDFTTSGASS